jgi:23S rRNA (cytidine1920-2'-O)/16S rRNA (cytidine1409-2'-O)-methyltransferase
MFKNRLDLCLVQRGLAVSRSLAQRLVMAGQVRVDGQVVLKSSVLVNDGAVIQVDRGPAFVSRGGEKLKGALQAFPVDVKDRICADVGASTGGFTDCLLQNGAGRVYAIDVGYGLLHWKLRNHPQVVIMERTNARFVRKLPEEVSLVTIDASFISLKIILPVVRQWFSPDHGDVIALIKPQFEAGKEQVARGEGVIRDPMVHREVLMEVLTYAETQGYTVRGLICSPLVGPKGNHEFLAYLGYSPVVTHNPLEAMVESALNHMMKIGYTSSGL